MRKVIAYPLVEWKDSNVKWKSFLIIQFSLITLVYGEAGTVNSLPYVTEGLVLRKEACLVRSSGL